MYEPAGIIQVKGPNKGRMKLSKIEARLCRCGYVYEVVEQSCPDLVGERRIKKDPVFPLSGILEVMEGCVQAHGFNEGANRVSKYRGSFFSTTFKKRV